MVMFPGIVERMIFAEKVLFWLSLAQGTPKKINNFKIVDKSMIIRLGVTA